MATGYTYGIVDGTINSFEQFAKLCARAMGATIHMKEESLDREYFPDEVSNYHLEALEKLKKEGNLDNRTNEEIIQEKKETLLKEIERVELENKEKKELFNKLNEFLVKATNYNPPTSEHQGIKDFMIDQLKQTIDWDADIKSNEEQIANLNERLNNINPDEIRDNARLKFENEIKYHEEYYQKDLKRVNDRNEWINQYFNSIKGL